MPTTTANDLIQLALKQIRVLGVGDILTDEDAQLSFEMLNLMLDSWSLDKLYIYHEALHSFNFVSGTGSYTIGPGADFVLAERPLKLTSAYTQSGGIAHPMGILTDATQYDNITVKGVGGGYPAYVWYEQTYPLGTLRFWPVPSGGVCNLRFWEPLQQFATLTSPIELPAGYKHTVMFNLALELSGAFGMDPPPAVAAIAGSSKTRLKRFNSRSFGMTSEAAYVSRDRDRYNIVSDGYR